MTDKIIERWQSQIDQMQKEYDSFTYRMELMLEEFERLADERSFLGDRMDAVRDKIVARQRPEAF